MATFESKALSISEKLCETPDIDLEQKAQSALFPNGRIRNQKEMIFETG
jgi:hypothetical protein